MATFKLSVPTPSQIQKGVSRVVLVFVAAAIGVWLITPNPFSKAAAWAGILAGITAVYQLVESTLTTL